MAATNVQGWKVLYRVPPQSAEEDQPCCRPPGFQALPVTVCQTGSQTAAAADGHGDAAARIPTMDTVPGEVEPDLSVDAVFFRMPGLIR